MDPPKKKKPKPLYRANDVTSLQRKTYKVEGKDIKKYVKGVKWFYIFKLFLDFSRRLIVDSNEFYRKAELAMSEQDDELSFECFYQYFRIIMCIQKSREYLKDKKYYELMMGKSKVMLTMQELERLSEVLEVR